MNFKLIGGILMVVGTCIGAGMLGLPVAAANDGLISSTLLIIFCWFIMTLGALYIIETNLKLPAGANLISMAKHTLGKPGAALTWIVNLLLLYALLAAYITGGTQITQANLHTPHVLSAIIFTVVMAALVLKGIHWVDYSNRALMSIKMLALILLIATIFPHMQASSATFGSYHKILGTTTVVICSFGYATILPSLRVYFEGNIPILKKTVVIGSVIPLAIYILWNVSVHSALPYSGSLSLTAMQETGNASSQLAHALATVTQSHMVSFFAHTFTAVCVLTSFLGVALSLSDFLVDGTGIKKDTLQGLSINALLTFLLPLLIAILYPKAFILALSFGGIFSIILLMILPMSMSIAAQYKLPKNSAYTVFGGNKMRVLALTLAFLVLICSIVFF